MLPWRLNDQEESPSAAHHSYTYTQADLCFIPSVSLSFEDSYFGGSCLQILAPETQDRFVSDHPPDLNSWCLCLSLAQLYEETFFQDRVEQSKILRTELVFRCDPVPSRFGMDPIRAKNELSLYVSVGVRFRRPDMDGLTCSSEWMVFDHSNSTLDCASVAGFLISPFLPLTNVIVIAILSVGLCLYLENCL